MTLYHFCCARDMRGIKSNGIIKGGVTVWQDTAGTKEGHPVIHMGWQWLTLDPEKEHQSWNTHVLLNYDRTEYRWTVEIPEAFETQLYGRDRMAKAIPGSEAAFDGWDGSENWRVYRGPIFRRWLKKLDRWNKQTGAWEAAL